MARLSSPTLVGRSSQLDRALKAALSAPSLVLVEGEAGVGKSRLVTELLAHPEMSDVPHLVGSCVDLREPLPLGPVAEALRGCESLPFDRLSVLGGAIANLLPELSGRLPAPLESTGDRAEDRHRLFRALIELLREIGPAVLVLEDAHWADEVSLDFLAVLLGSPPPHLRLVVSVRADELETRPKLRQLFARVQPDLHFERVDLPTLDREQTGSLAAAIVGVDGVSEEFASYLFDRTGGLPFAIEELVRLMVEQRDVSQEETGWVRKPLDQLDVPVGVREFVLSRFGRLSANARLLVQTSAVLGVDTDERSLSAVSELSQDEVSWSLEEVMRSGLLIEREGRIRFRHALAAQAIHEDIPEPSARRLHNRAAGLYETLPDRPLAMLAYHYERAGRGKEFVLHARDGARRAAEAGEYRLSLDLLTRALARPELDRGDIPDLAILLADTALNALASEQAIPVLRSVLEEQWEPLEEGKLRRELARLLYESRDAEAAKLEYQRAFELLVDAEPFVAGKVAMMFATPCWHPAMTRREHLDWLDRAAALTRSEGDAGRKWSLKFDDAGIRRHLGEPLPSEEISALPTDSADPALKFQIARGFMNLAFTSLDTGHDEQAGEFIEIALSRCGPSRLYRVALITYGLRLDLLRGRWGGLEARLREELQAVPYLAERLDLDLSLAHILMATGRVDEALARFEEVHDEVYRSGFVHLVPTAAAGLARMREFEDRQAEGLDILRRAAGMLRTKELLSWAAPVAVPLVAGLIEDGERTEAERFTHELTQVQEQEAPAAGAALLACKALLEADSLLLDEAAAAFAAIPRAYQSALVRESCSPHCGREIEDLQASLASYEALGATWDAQRAARRLRAAGVSVTRGRRGRRGYGNELSPREREVAELIAIGCTNEEIARRLFLSPKTVARHVENGMRKTESQSRAALAVSVATVPEGRGQSPSR